jgi:repressor LexA
MIKDNIKKLRQKHGLTQSELGRIAGVSDKAVSTWERGDAEPRMGAVEKMAAYFRISKSAIIDNVTVPEARELPILGEICAGPGIFCDENYSGAFYIDRSIKADCCLIVSGDSMRDAGIMDRDIAFVKKQDRYRDGDIVAVIIRDENTAAIKKICFNGPDAVLMPCNPDYPPAVIALEEIIIVGKVIGAYRSLQ